jgi:hypothetical protein
MVPVAEPLLDEEAALLDAAAVFAAAGAGWSAFAAAGALSAGAVGVDPSLLLNTWSALTPALSAFCSA